MSHTNKPGGAELGLRRHLEATSLPSRLVTLEAGGVWEGMNCEVVHVQGLRGLRKALRSGGLIVGNTMRAAFYCAILAPNSSKLVYWVQDGLTDSAMARRALSLTKHITARRTRHYLANSKWTAETVQHALGIGREQIDVVYSMSGVNEDMLSSTERRDSGDTLRLLFLGRITPWKAPDVAIRALRSLRDLGINATLTVAGGVHFGEQQYADELHALADKDPDTEIVGHIDDVWDLLGSHDVLVHCSTVPEPFGQVVVQALAAGTIAVASQHGGPLEILGGSPVPLLYKPGDPEDLARVLLNATHHRKEVRQWGFNRAAYFSDMIIVERTDSALRRLLAEFVNQQDGTRR